MLKKTIRRLGALAMVLAMAVSVFAVNASAATESNKPSPTLTKVIEKEENVYLPTTTFEFEAVDGRASDDTVAAAPAVKDVFKKATAESNVVASIDIAPTEDTLASKAVTKTVDIEINEDKVPVGVFYYTIKEKNGEYDGMKYDTTTEKTFVIMKDNEGNVTYGFVAWNDQTKAWEKSANNTFTNKYMDDGKDHKGPHDLMLKKLVEGKAYDKNLSYKFYVTITNKNAPAVEWYKIVRTNATSTTEEKIVAGVPTEITVAKDETVTIKGLSPQDTYIVEEADYTGAAYKYEVPTATKKVGDNTAINLTLTKKKDTFASDSVTMGDANNTVTVTNKKDFATPGGVIMTIAPYALMLVVAGAFAVVFLSRRNRAE